jgi:hypothetical protein
VPAKQAGQCHRREEIQDVIQWGQRALDKQREPDNLHRVGHYGQHHGGTKRERGAFRNESSAIATLNESRISKRVCRLHHHRGGRTLFSTTGRPDSRWNERRITRDRQSLSARAPSPEPLGQSGHGASVFCALSAVIRPHFSGQVKFNRKCGAALSRQRLRWNREHRDRGRSLGNSSLPHPIIFAFSSPSVECVHPMIAPRCGQKKKLPALANG